MEICHFLQVLNSYFNGQRNIKWEKTCINASRFDGRMNTAHRPKLWIISAVCVCVCVYMHSCECTYVREYFVGVGSLLWFPRIELSLSGSVIRIFPHKSYCWPSISFKYGEKVSVHLTLFTKKGGKCSDFPLYSSFWAVEYYILVITQNS